MSLVPWWKRTVASAILQGPSCKLGPDMFAHHLGEFMALMPLRPLSLTLLMLNLLIFAIWLNLASSF